MMQQAWLIFKIDNRNVYQIRYNGCVGMDVIEDYKEMIAKEYKVSEEDVKVTIDDEVIQTRSLVISELKRKVKADINRVELLN